MAFTIFRILNNSLILICVISLFTKCEANELTDYEEEEFNEFVQGGLLRHISKSIGGWDDGNYVNCVRDLAAWSQGFTSFETWALKMLDAGGRPPHGLLEGNINSVGMFEECLGISHKRNDSRIIKGKYCLARFPLPLSILGRNKMLSTSPKAVMGGALQNNQRIMNSGPKGYYFNLAVCFPASCEASFVETTLAAALTASNISLSIELPAEYCYSDDPKPWDAGEIVALVVLVLIGVLLVCGTLYDVYFQAKKTADSRYQNNLLMAFSMYTNSKRLTTLSKDPGPLACIHGIRVLSIFWIILGHRYVEGISIPVENLFDMISWSTSYAGMTIVASTVSVDTFFLLSGILLSYIFFRRTDNKSLRDIPVMYLHRFLRLTPVMVMVMLFQMTFTAKLGRGPFWRQLNIGIDDCKDYWWSMILYVQNYVNPENMCLAQTWYLSVDMQLYILSPLLLFPILKHVKIGVAWIATWILAALITVFTLSYIKEWAAANNSDPSVMDRTINYYYGTHTRASPWLIGLLAGYYLRIFNLKEIKINKILVGTLWIASLAVMAAVLYGMKPLSESTHVFTYLEDTTYLAFSRPAWALAVLWVIVACALGYGGPVNWFLSLRLWEFLARLSYSMYLIHIIIINLFVSSTKTIPYFSHETLVHHFFGDLLMTIVVSYFMVLAFESPVTVLEKYIFSKDTKKPTSQENLVLDPEQMKRSQENPNF